VVKLIGIRCVAFIVVDVIIMLTLVLKLGVVLLVMLIIQMILLRIVNMVYRVDFSRLARTESEISTAKGVTDFLETVLSGRARDAVRTFHDNLPDGHILDTIRIGDKPNLSGQDILERHIIPKYPEATLRSWDAR
jgi:hypothetical protein